MKEWKCEVVGHHQLIGKKIEEYQKQGWVLHTYSTAKLGPSVMHYLLFEKHM